MRMLRFAVLGLIGSAVLSLITPVTFIDWSSWVIFAVVCFFTILPLFIKKSADSLKSALNILSHPILLIILAGIAGYLIY